MERAGAPRLAWGVVGLLPGAVLLAVVALLAASPPLDAADAGLAWVEPVLATVLLVAATLAALAHLVEGLRTRRVRQLLETGAWAALAGSAVGILAGAASIAVPVAGAAGMLAAAALTRDSIVIRDTATTRLAAVAVLVLAESLVLIVLVPAASAWLAPYANWVFVAALGLAAVTVVVDPAHRGPSAALLGAGSAGLLADRNGSAEGLIGLGALGLAALVSLIPRPAVRAVAEPIEEPDDERLPDLAAQLPEAVLRFDGGLALREWNGAAATLLGLDAGSVGMRAEDLLGMSVADLRVGDTATVMRGAVGGLDIVLHRSGGGITAVVRDPGARPEADRIGQELRATIEELLRARRTIDLQRGELERSATVDALTGVSTRGAILERLRLEVAQARRYRHSLAIALLDIDGFTEINRLHGHAAGDAVLREVALRFRLRTRQADALGRVGGDELLAILPHTDAAGAATFADALRHRLEMRSVEAGEVHLRVTVSIGISAMQSGEDLELDGLLARGQEALDSARAAGGNRIALDRLHGLARLEDPHERGTADAGDGADAV